MKTFANRLHELVDGNSIKHNLIADNIGIDETKLSRIFNNEKSNPKISVLQGIVKGYNLNPYRLYKLLIGEEYTDNPVGSIETENKSLYKKIEDQQKRIDFLEDQLKEQIISAKKANTALANITESYIITPKIMGGSGLNQDGKEKSVESNAPQ